MTELATGLDHASMVEITVDDLVNPGDDFTLDDVDLLVMSAEVHTEFANRVKSDAAYRFSRYGGIYIYIPSEYDPQEFAGMNIRRVVLD